MSTTFRSEGAKIYEFPRRPRAAAGEPRRDDHAGDIHRLRRFLPVEFGSGWYHEAAMQDVERGHKS